MTTSTKKKKKNADRLSLLPEDIHSHILSLMPTRFAVRTSILSKKWRYNWMLAHNLDFDDISSCYGKDCHVEFIYRMLTLKKSKLDYFGLKISKWSFPKPTLSKWIDEAIKLNVSELDIQVKKLDLPSSLFTCKTLTKLRLQISQTFNPRYKPLWDCPSLVTLPCLKTLDIVIHSKPFDNAFKLINGCPILENLSLVIEKRDPGYDYYFHTPTLKRLTLAIHSLFYELPSAIRSKYFINKVVLDVPNLEYLCVKEDSLNSLFVMKDVSSLVEAKALCGVENKQHLFIELLNGIRQAKYISLDIQHRHSLSYQRKSPFPDFSNVKRLELKGRLLIPQILERCSELQHLCINKPYWDEKTPSVPSCMVSNLKTLKLTNTLGRKSDLQFLKLMLANLKTLKKLTVVFSYELSHHVQEALSQEISILPRASKDCEIHFVEEWPHSTTTWYFKETS